MESKKKENKKIQSKDCPHCGRCPVCGRGGIEVTPWYPYRVYPYYDNTGTTDNADGVTITFRDDCLYCK